MPMVFVLTRCTCAKTILGGPTVLAAFRYSLVSRQYLFPILPDFAFQKNTPYQLCFEPDVLRLSHELNRDPCIAVLPEILG